MHTLTTIVAALCRRDNRRGDQFLNWPVRQVLLADQVRPADKGSNILNIRIFMVYIISPRTIPCYTTYILHSESQIHKYIRMDCSEWKEKRIARKQATLRFLENEVGQRNIGLESEKMMTAKEKMNTYRTTARAVGVMYLAGIVVGIVGNVLIQSVLGAPDHLSTVPANSMLVAIGAMLWLMAVAWRRRSRGPDVPGPEATQRAHRLRLPRFQDRRRRLSCRHGSLRPAPNTAG